VGNIFNSVGQVIIFLTALIGLLTGLVGYRKGIKSSNKLDQIKVEVDGHLSEVLSRVAQLTEVLDSKDIAVPADPATDNSRHTEAIARKVIKRADERDANGV
jgi:hypothetical protein